MDLHDVSIAFQFAEEFVDDETMPADDRRAMREFLAATRDGDVPTEEQLRAVQRAHNAWVERLNERTRFFAYLPSDDLIAAVGDHDTIVLAGDSTTKDVRISGQLVGGACMQGRGIAVLPTAPLLEFARKHEGLGVESLRSGFSITPSDAWRTETMKTLYFDDDGQPTTAPPT